MLRNRHRRVEHRRVSYRRVKRVKHAQPLLRARACNQRKQRKQRLFQRDGWLDGSDREWKAVCAFGCGEVLTFETATVDRWPVPGRCGGTYRIANTRLACGPCNWRDGREAQQRELAGLPCPCGKCRLPELFGGDGD